MRGRLNNTVFLPLLMLIVPARHFNFVCDDAFISFRYAQNLICGHGLVWNIGEQPPVEGYTNFSWVILMACVMKWGLDPVACSKLLGIVFGVCTLVLAGVFGERILHRKSFYNLLAPALLACCSPYAAWCTGGGWKHSCLRCLSRPEPPPIFMKRTAIDRLGITNSHIAHTRRPHLGKGVAGHEKRRFPYVLSRRPTYFFGPLVFPRNDRYCRPAAADLRWFHSLYEPVVLNDFGGITIYRLRPQHGRDEGAALSAGISHYPQYTPGFSAFP